MKLLLKFNLVFLAVFLGGLAASALIVRDLLQRDAHDEMLDRARLLMDTALATRTYTATQVSAAAEGRR